MHYRFWGLLDSCLAAIAAMTFWIFILISQMVVAKPEHPQMFGKNASFHLSDLPQNSRLRKSLERLPETVRGRAMNHLHGFSFPRDDVEYLEADLEGRIFYIETYLPHSIISTPSAASAQVLALPLVDAMKLHSRPRAARVVFLDFDGHIITRTAWNNNDESYVESYYALPFDIESPANPNFNSDELNRIHEIWHRIAEDFAPFDIDVTTEEPISFSPSVGRILFTKDVDALGKPMPFSGYGGVSYVDVWGLTNYPDYQFYSPAIVYYNNMGPNHAPYMAEAGSHEFGHNLGLAHDGTTNGSDNINCPGTTGYYCGHGTGLTS
jgi:hypothetical protein